MEISAEEEKKINRLISKTLTEKNPGYTWEEWEDLKNGESVFLNLKKTGRRMGWRTTKHGLKYQTLIEDEKAILSDEGETIAANCCRACKEIIKPYTALYFQTIASYYNTINYKVYACNNNYCETCAKAKSEIKPLIRKSPKVIRETSYHLKGDQYETRITEFEGFTMQSNEAWKKKE